MKTKITQEILESIINKKEINNVLFTWINFAGYKFDLKKLNDCDFENCNLSNISIKNTSLNNVRFIKSKIMWVKFYNISKFISNFEFEECNISLSSFSDMELENMKFWESSIIDTDFMRVKLKWVDFSYCDLDKCRIIECDLEKADFRWAKNFNINPKYNKLNKTIFSNDNAYNLLDYLDIIIK